MVCIADNKLIICNNFLPPTNNFKITKVLNVLYYMLTKCIALKDVRE